MSNDFDYVSLRVSKESAEKWRSISDEKQRQIAFDEYIETVKEASKKEFKANLESLEEDVAMYTGLMLKVKQTFEKTKREQLDASYKMWEKIEEELPSVREKTGNIVAQLKPITEELKQIESLFSKINTYSLDRFVESLSRMISLAKDNRELFDHIIDFYTLK